MSSAFFHPHFIIRILSSAIRHPPPSGLRFTETPVRAWLIVDKLKLNKDKSEFMLVGTRQQLSKVRTDSLMVGDTQVKSVSEARNLSVWFDSNLKFRSHINKTCQSAFFSLYNIRRIRKYLPFEAAKSLVQALL